MIRAIESDYFTVPLSIDARLLAQQYRQQQTSAQKAKQVYLNTLAVSAVDFYVQCLGFETDIEHSDSHNFVAIKFMNVADLTVKQLGKIECRPVLPEAQICQIPPEVSSDRIGYVAVRLDRALRQGTLLGFTTAAVAEIPLSQLRSLSEFPAYLNSIRPKAAIELKNWFEGIFEDGWQTVEATLSPKQYQLAIVRNKAENKAGVRRAKLIDLGIQLNRQTVILTVAIARNSNQSTNVLVQIHPEHPATFLPANLALVMLDESGKIIQEVRSRSQDNFIQLQRFKGQTGDRFSIQVGLEQIRVTESFVF